MTTSPMPLAQQHAAFAQLSPSGISALGAAARISRVEPGQALCIEGQVPNRILLILEGQARLIGRSAGRLTTFAKPGPGSFVGLASLLRGAGCEQVQASTAMRVLVLPDALVLELHRTEPTFRRWCEQTVFEAEVLALLQHLAHLQPVPHDIEAPFLREACGKAGVDNAETLSASLEQPGKALFLASANVPDLELGHRFQPGDPVPRPEPPLPLRVISLADGLLEAIEHQRDRTAPSGAGSDTEPETPDAALDLVDAPQGTSLNLGQQDPVRQLKLIRGEGALEETMACFAMLATLMKLPLRRDAVERVVRDAIRRGQSPSIPLVGQLAAGMGLHVVGLRVKAELTPRLQTPALLPWGQGLALVVGSSADGLKIASPKEGWLQLSTSQLQERYPEGLDVLMVDRTTSTPEQRFGLNWFIPALRRHRGALIQVLVASFVVQLFTLANPLLIQVIIDKVIHQRSLDTLQVLGFALVVVTLLEGVLTSLRTFLFTETTNRIDTRLGAEVIDHLLRLPLGYFDRRPVGELGTRIGELEKIRNFLTGQALTTVLDAAFSVIYIVVMALYSWVLTLVALSVVPIQIALTVLGAPLFRRQFRAAAEDNAKTQSHLVEVLTGIQTVKAQNVEMVSRWKWQERYSSYIARSFEKTLTGTAVSQTSQVLQKISQLLVLWVGATLVLNGELTLGQLIAFRIISSYVTQPLLRLSSIWQNIQELKVSFERLADVVDTPQESDETDKGKIALPPIHGKVEIQNLNFTFSPNTPEVLKNVNLEVNQGTFVGIVGQSGSGKSTLMKLLPRLYSPTAGRILVDGYDIDKVELYSLRRQIGIVPQDPLLFSGSVAENIALTDPEATSDAIVEAAQIACAHDFIMDLASGYSTPVGERGASLSGGQRQRVAIARTLLSKPRLLIMDEATSALDYDTERRVCEQLRENLKDCTVFFITHRLTTIRNADLIVMMHQGAIVEQGTHQELMAQRGRYFALYQQQEAN
jgi:ATP-binding cassette subfamily B protein